MAEPCRRVSYSPHGQENKREKRLTFSSCHQEHVPMTQLSPTRPYFFKAPLVASCCQYRAFGDVENLNHSIRSGCIKRLLPYQFHTQRCFCILASVLPYSQWYSFVYIQSRSLSHSGRGRRQTRFTWTVSSSAFPDRGLFSQKYQRVA